MLEDLFDNILIFIQINGHTANKKEWIAEMLSGRFIYNVIKVKKASAEVYGETAVLVGKAAFTVTIGGYKGNFNLLYTEVYTIKNKKW